MSYPNFNPFMQPGRPFHHIPNAMPNFVQARSNPIPQFTNVRPNVMPNFGYPRAPYPTGMVPPTVSAAKGALPKLDAFMETANKFLSTAQSFQPYIQQATPMIRNLPALWKIYKGFQSVPSATEGAEKTGKRNTPSNPTKSSHRKGTQQNNTTRPSVPRIYQPPYNFD